MDEKNQGGRPREYDRDQIALEFEKYIQTEAIPLCDDFCDKNEIPPSTFAEWPEVRLLVDRCKGKARVGLLRLALRGKVKESVAIFALKNLGMTDRQNIEHSGAVTINRPFDVIGIEPKRQQEP